MGAKTDICTTGMAEGMDRCGQRLESHEMGSEPDTEILARCHHELRISRRRLVSIQKLLVAIFFGLLAIIGIEGMKLRPGTPAASEMTPQTGAMDSLPEVQFATRGGWIADSGSWAKFGVVGAAFNGERIVLNSAESPHGNLSCWISPRGRPMPGVCLETSGAALSPVAANPTCSWRIVVYSVTQDAIRGAKVLNPEESDLACVNEYGSLPSTFLWQRPQGLPARDKD
jgi:hypothetical protein